MINTELELAYDWVIVTYFFLGGMSAGVFLFSVCANYWKVELKPLGKMAGILAPVVLSVGMLALLFHLGKPFRMYRLYTSGLNVTSALSWGAWFLLFYLIVSALYAWNLFKDNVAGAKKFGYLGVPLAVLVASYTGVLLSQAIGRPLWHSTLMPVLFMNGALISGIALAVLVSAGRQDKALVGKVAKFLGVLVLVEVGMIVAEMVVLTNAGGTSAVAAWELITGQYAVQFIGVSLVLGAVVPAVMLLWGKTSPKLETVASALILVGIFMMRYVLVIGGQHLTPTGH